MKHLLLAILLPFSLLSQTIDEDVRKLLSKKQYKTAQLKLEGFIKTNNNHVIALELLADTYGYQEQWDKAANYYKKLIAINPKNANYHYKFGGALGIKALGVNKLKALGLIDTIKTAFLTAAKLDKNHIDTRWTLVELYMQLPGIFGGSKKKALHYAKELETISKLDGYLAKGYVYEYDNKLKLAKTFYNRAFALPNALHCNYKRNAMHYQIGKICAQYNIELKKGEQCLHIYLKHYTTKDGVPKAWAHYRLAQIHKHKNNKKLALKHIDLAITQLPKRKIFKVEKEAIIKLAN